MYNFRALSLFNDYRNQQKQNTSENIKNAHGTLEVVFTVYNMALTTEKKRSGNVAKQNV